MQKDLKSPFSSGNIYHVFNRCVKGQLLFYNSNNYHFFLKKIQLYLSDIVDILAWTLIPNHFHIIAKVKNINIENLSYLEKCILSDPQKGIDFLVRERFRRLFLSYSHSLKKQTGINTNVFAQKFKHKLVDKNDQLTQLFFYIHANVTHHKISENWKDYEWSSYWQVIEGDCSFIDLQTTIDWFGSKEAFIDAHKLNCTAYVEKSRDS